MRRWWRTTSSPVTSSVSCSCFARVTITVRAVHVWNRYIKTVWCFSVSTWALLRCRFSELPADTGWQHHYNQHHHLYCGLPPTTPGETYDSTWRPNKRFKKLSINGYDFVLSFVSIQESISDFYWYYSGKDVIDDPGKKNFSKAMTVAKQIFNSLTEYIQVKFEKKKQKQKNF